MVNNEIITWEKMGKPMANHQIPERKDEKTYGKQSDYHMGKDGKTNGKPSDSYGKD